jgi:hypothetical protein
VIRDDALMLDREPALVTCRRKARAVLGKLAGEVFDVSERRSALLDGPHWIAVVSALSRQRNTLL